MRSPYRAAPPYSPGTAAVTTATRSMRRAIRRSARRISAMPSRSMEMAAAARCICPSPMAARAYAPHGSRVPALRASVSWLCMSIQFHIPVRCKMALDPKSERAAWRDPSQISSARSFVLMAAGVLIGLILAGYSLFTARSASTLIVPAEDVALVNQQPVSRADYLALLQTLYGVDLSHATLEQRHKVLDDMIREELFVQRGKELDVAATDPEVRSALENAITSQPSEAALRQFFDTHQDRYGSEGVMRVRDLLNGRDSGRTKGEEFYFA